jgi:hypothetical protein
MNMRCLLAASIVWAVASCASDPNASNDPSDPNGVAAWSAPGGGTYSMRFEISYPACTVALFDSGGPCASTDTTCLCRPEFDAIDTAKGSAGNPNGKLIVLAQPQWGLRSDGTYAFDAYTTVKNQGNFAAHFVNSMNPDLTCTAAQSWSGVGCTGGTGCGWRCVTGTQRANDLVAEENSVWAISGVSPKWIVMNEAWSILFDNDSTGIDYRTWIRDLTKQMSQSLNKWPLVFVQERHAAAGPYTLLGETASYAWFGVEAYLSGREVLDAPGQCVAPYDSSNWCYQQYNTIRESVRNSASPAIPYDRLIMTEHFATNTLYDGGTLNSWGRTYDNDPSSPTYGTPSTSSWNNIIDKRDHALKALPTLGGFSSYAWQGNSSGTGSSYRVEFEQTYAAFALP